MPYLIAVLFEDNKEDSYIAVELEGEEPQILFAKGPSFTKRMGPFPVPYAEATFRKWNYCRVTNPVEVDLDDPRSMLEKMICLHRQDDRTALYCPENT